MVSVLEAFSSFLAAVGIVNLEPIFIFFVYRAEDGLDRVVIIEDRSAMMML